MDEEDRTPPPEEEASPEAEKAREGPVSLHPLSFEDAVDALLQIKPEPPPRPRKKKTAKD